MSAFSYVVRSFLDRRLYMPEVWRKEAVEEVGPPDWPGYFGDLALARAAYGKHIAQACATFVQTAAFRILDGEDIDATAHSDRTPPRDGALGERKQNEWL